MRIDDLKNFTLYHKDDKGNEEKITLIHELSYIDVNDGFDNLNRVQIVPLIRVVFVDENQHLRIIEDISSNFRFVDERGTVQNYDFNNYDFNNNEYYKDTTIII